MMTRAETIKALIDADQTFRFDDNFGDWFEMILREGFKGYRHMSDSELAQEYAERAACGFIVAAD